MATDGYVDGIKGGAVLGWAFDRARPGDRVELEVAIDGETVGGTVANLERADLLRRDIGDGRHGFRFQLPGPLEPGGSYRLAVLSTRDGTVLPLVEEYLAQADADADATPIALTADEGAADRGPIAGTGGWLFEGGDRRRLARVLGESPAGPAWSHDQLARLRREDERLSQMDIDYLLASLPPKAAVYADRLADAPALGEHRPAAQLAAAMRDEPRLELLDLLDPLRDARRHGRVFTRTGSALTWLGAFHAYRALVKELAKRHPRIEPLPVTALQLGDLVAVEDRLGGEAEVEPALVRDGLRARRAEVPNALAHHLPPGAEIYTQRRTLLRLSAVIVHEGPAERIVPFLADHFARTVVVTAGDEIPAGVPEHVRPTVVIQILSEGGALLR